MSTVALAVAAVLLVLIAAGIFADARVRRRGEDADAIAAIFDPPWPTSKPAITRGSELACKGRVPR